jgi:flagellar motor switch/type III secretory pathway protein FliN
MTAVPSASLATHAALARKYGGRPLASLDDDVYTRMKEAFAELRLQCARSDLLNSGSILAATNEDNVLLVFDEAGYRLFARAASGCLNSHDLPIQDDAFTTSLMEEAGAWFVSHTLATPGIQFGRQEDGTVEFDAKRNPVQALSCEIWHQDQRGLITLLWPDSGREGSAPRQIGKAIDDLRVSVEVHIGVARYSVAEISRLKPGDVLPLRVSGRSPVARVVGNKGMTLAAGMLGRSNGASAFRCA